MSLQRIMQVFLIFIGLLIFVTQFFVENTAAGSLWIVSIFYMLLLALLLEIKGKFARPLIFMLVLHSIFWIAIRLCSLNFDINSIEYEYLVGRAIPYRDINFTVLISLLLTLVLTAGTMIGGKIKIRQNNNPGTIEEVTFFSNIRESFSFKYFVFILMFTMLELNILHADPHQYWFQVVSILISYNAILILFISYSVAFWKNFSLSKKQAVLLICLLFIAIRALRGSKGGCFQILILVLPALLVFKHNILFSKKLAGFELYLQLYKTLFMRQQEGCLEKK